MFGFFSFSLVNALSLYFSAQEQKWNWIKWTGGKWNNVPRHVYWQTKYVLNDLVIWNIRESARSTKNRQTPFQIFKLQFRSEPKLHTSFWVRFQECQKLTPVSLNLFCTHWEHNHDVLMWMSAQLFPCWLPFPIFSAFTIRGLLKSQCYLIWLMTLTMTDVM